MEKFAIIDFAYESTKNKKTDTSILVSYKNLKVLSNKDYQFKDIKILGSRGIDDNLFKESKEKIKKVIGRKYLPYRPLFSTKLCIQSGYKHVEILNDVDRDMALLLYQLQ